MLPDESVTYFVTQITLIGVFLLLAVSFLKIDVNTIPYFDLVLESELALCYISLDTRNSSGFPGSYLLYEAVLLLS